VDKALAFEEAEDLDEVLGSEVLSRLDGQLEGRALDVRDEDVEVVAQGQAFASPKGGFALGVDAAFLGRGAEEIRRGCFTMN
jgi:hypothetical protein